MLRNLLRPLLLVRWLTAGFWLTLTLFLNCLFVSVPFVAGVAAAELGQRVALVIGNSDYMTAPLINPTNDSTLMAQTLTDLGFLVSHQDNLSQSEMKRAILDFGIKLEDMGSDTTGLFYYAGHGMQVDGINYLVPVDADIHREADVAVLAVAASDVISQMKYARNALNIVILDACRNNPYTRSFRNAVGGLARMEAPRGTMIAYSTRPGDVAADGFGNYSPYTKALVAAMQIPGLSLSDLFIQARVAVMAATNEDQVPWEEGGLTAKFYFKPVSVAETRLPSAPVVDDNTAEVEFWVLTENRGTAEAYEDYLIRFPEGLFAGLAKNRLENVQLQAALVQPSEPVPKVGTEMDLALWQAAKETGTAEAYEDYLVRVPEGEFATHARLRFEALMSSRAAPVASSNMSSEIGVARRFNIMHVMINNHRQVWAEEILEGQLQNLPLSAVVSEPNSVLPDDTVISVAVTRMAVSPDTEYNAGVDMSEKFASVLLGAFSGSILPDGLLEIPRYKIADISVVVQAVDHKSGQTLTENGTYYARHNEELSDERILGFALQEAILLGGERLITRLLGGVPGELPSKAQIEAGWRAQENRSTNQQSGPYSN